jgi:rod shape-determining protein MreC
MRSLLNFLIRHSSLILFLVLEGIAFVMLSSTHNYHNSVTSNLFGGVTARLTTNVENVKSFTRLRQINRQLAYENAILRQKLEGTGSVGSPAETVVNDTVNKLYYNYISARVVNNSVNKQKNYLTLDKGLNNGIMSGMAVVGPDGIIGVITASSPNYSVAMSVLNIDFRLSAKIAKNNYFGSMSWNGKNHRYAQVSEIPHHVDVAEGDTILTTGYSAIFPEGLMIGTVAGEPKAGGDFLTLNVMLSTDFKKITYVYIIKSHEKSERERLETEVTNE